MKIKDKWLQIESYSGDNICLPFIIVDNGKMKCEFDYEGYRFCVCDTYNGGEKELFLKREIQGICCKTVREKNGISLSSMFEIGDENSSFRVGIPSCTYGEYVDRYNTSYRSFMEDRLTGPMIVLFDEKCKEGITIQKIVPAKFVEKEKRKYGECDFLQKTEVTSLGYGFGKKSYIKVCWPYEEKEKSVALNAKETPVKAFYPLEGQSIDICLEYRISSKHYDSFTEALYSEYKKLFEIFERKGERVVSLPFSIEEEIEYRRDSVKKTFREFGENGAGFFFHFDPKYGYQSAPSGFGTSFNCIPHETYTHILEYGFTGRQLDIALEMAKERGEYLKKSEKVIDFFVNECVMENGWVYSLYDVKDGRPIHSFGDPTAPRLHYMYYDKCAGNYLRTMAEPMNDLLAAYLWYKDQGIEKPMWIKAVKKFADFLISNQNVDGSWYRAYTQEAYPVFMNDKKECSEELNDRGRKASTIIPVIFLCELAKYFPEDTRYLQAAKKAGVYTLIHEGERELYQGGTMDNPNIVDKEAAQYVMAGLYHLYERTGEKIYLSGAKCAAKQFVTWNYIWNAPMQRGTILYEKEFRTKGMGAINSIWCGGVVDIYSLFHIRELYMIGRETEDDFLEKMAEMICIATHQIMSYKEDDMGFKDSGMQPEGFGICAQGMDDGMIQKGDIWGSLGWIYSAGIFGVKRYLDALKSVKAPDSISIEADQM